MRFICFVKRCKRNISKWFNAFLTCSGRDSMLRWLMIHTDPQIQLVPSLLLGVMHMESKGNGPSSLRPSVFLDNIRIWIIKVQSKWENVNETRDGHPLTLSWWTRNEERGKLSQDHVHADTWETDEVEAIVFIWMQIQKEQRTVRGGTLEEVTPSSVSVARRRAGSNRGPEGLSSLLCLCEHALWHWHSLTQTMHSQTDSTKAIIKNNMNGFGMCAHYGVRLIFLVQLWQRYFAFPFTQNGN